VMLREAWATDKDPIMNPAKTYKKVANRRWHADRF